MTRIPLNRAFEESQDVRQRLEMSTAEIGLAVRTTNCLEERGVFTVNDLLHCTREDLLSISNFGEKTLEEVYKALENVGFYRPDPPSSASGGLPSQRVRIGPPCGATLQWAPMATRLRLFVKKRGQRRTGSRWYGTLGVAALDLALVAIGAVGLYWLLAHVLLAEGETHGWFAWAAIVIPIAPIVYGVTDVIVLVWRNLASTERRAAVVQMASDWELPGMSRPPDRPALPAVPPSTRSSNSAGVRLAFRLPSDAASGQMSFALAAVSVIWNSLVAGFAIQVVRQHLAGHPNWLLTWLLVPFVLAGAWTIFALVRQILLTAGTGTTLLEIAEHPLYPGRKYEAFLSQTGRLHVRWFQVQLVCEERATYQQGTDTRTAAAIVHRETVFSERKFEIPPGRRVRDAFHRPVPATAMHSFSAAHNAVSWMLVVRGRMARWPEFERPLPALRLSVIRRQTSDAMSASTRRVAQASP